MATLIEQRQAFEDPTLRLKVQQAVIVAAKKVINEAPATTNHTNRLVWAKSVLPIQQATVDEFLQYVIAANDTATLAQILGATDAQIQTNIDSAVDAFS